MDKGSCDEFIKYLVQNKLILVFFISCPHKDCEWDYFVAAAMSGHRQDMVSSDWWMSLNLTNHSLSFPVHALTLKLLQNNPTQNLCVCLKLASCWPPSELAHLVRLLAPPQLNYGGETKPCKKLNRLEYSYLDKLITADPWPSLLSAKLKPAVVWGMPVPLNQPPLNCALLQVTFLKSWHWGKRKNIAMKGHRRFYRNHMFIPKF